ncbi:MAG: nucleotidyltransferase [Omnitrophica bacterium GWA2_52_12]|nr:MAG: nucleotidyltransferase [Omnitrophica bacterium GWA2_52_12]
MSKDEILEKIRANRDVLKRLGVKRLALFGSHARGQAHAASDLDFLVEFDKKTFDAYFDLKEFLENLFQRKVDLVLPDAIKPRLRPTILGELVDAA